MEENLEQAGEIAQKNDQQISPEAQKGDQTAKKPKSGLKKSLSIILVLLVLAIVGAISWALFSNKTTSKKQETTTEQEQEETEEQPKEEETPVEEFKTYINKDQLFQFTYPTELEFEQLTVFSEEPTHYRVSYAGKLQDVDIEKESDLVDGYIFRVAVYDNVTTPLKDLIDMKREKFILDCPESADIQEAKNELVNGQKGYRFVAEKCTQNYIIHIVGYAGKVYEIAEVYKGDVGLKLSYLGRVNEILNDFEFVKIMDPVDPDGLKAYTNERYGFSFRHPYLNEKCCEITGPTSKGVIHIATLAAMPEDTTNFKGRVDGIAVFIDGNKDNLEFEDYIEVQKRKLIEEYKVILSQNPTPIEQELTLDGQKSYYLNGYAWWGDVVYVPLKTNKNILMVVKTELEEDGFEETLKNILSTFEYLEKQ